MIHTQAVRSGSFLSLDSPSLGEAEALFRQRYPAFDSTAILDELRATEYARLDEQGQVYLDYTGGGLYAFSQLREHIRLLSSQVFGNPHSSNPTSQAMTELDEQARAFVLAFFNASPDEYTVIFTPNASGALRLVGEAYPFTPHGQLLLSSDNHNSVNGLREFARAKGAPIACVPLEAPELPMEEPTLFSLLDKRRDAGHRLFAYPAQSNFTGVQHPLAWINEAQERGWDVLLDAASFVPGNRLDRSEEHTSELQSPDHLVCRLLLEKKKKQQKEAYPGIRRTETIARTREILSTLLQRTD